MNDMDLTTDPSWLATTFLADYIWSPEENPPMNTSFYTLRRWKEDFYIWKNGRYRKIAEDTVRVNVTRYLQDLSRDTLYYEKRLTRITKNLISNVIVNIEPLVHIRETWEMNSFLDSDRSGNVLSLENGLLNLDTRRLDPHTPDFFTTVKLPFDYDPDAKCPLFDAFLEQVMLNRRDYIDLLLEFMGYLFRPDLSEQKLLLCVGDGANGKGVLFEVISALVGVENCSQVPISRFADRFTLQGTIGKVCNLTNESSHVLEEEAENVLKSYCSGDRMTIDRKHREPLEVKPTAKLLISTNALPRYNDKSHAIWRRILLVPFDYNVDETSQIRNLADKLKKELPGILNRALEGLDRLNACGFTIPHGQKELMEEYRRDADPARAFLLDNYEESLIGTHVRCSELYEAYRRFCEKTGCRPMNDRTFGREVRRTFPKVKRQRIGYGSNREYVYENLMPYIPYKP